MKIIFSKRRHVGSWLIRTVTWSEWSHVELVLPNGQLLGAAAPQGVVKYMMHPNGISELVFRPINRMVL